MSSPTESRRAPAPPSEPSRVGGLESRVPAGGENDPGRILELFVAWTRDQGFELYPAQEEALLELMAGHHVVLNTPTGSGKSLVALGLHFKALCEGSRCYYTSPIKALASEKFFALCNDLGARNVGMQTGDATINAKAPIICCTAEILSNLSLRLGSRLRAPYVVMDEFHYYADPERGTAWQIPLLTLPETLFLLMSATLGNTASIEEQLHARTGVEVARVTSDERPVPLDYEYRETRLHQTVADLMAAGKLPIYIVNFTQRECAELAQSLTSLQLTARTEKRTLRRAIGDFHFDTPYGKELHRFLSFGIGIHHAGLLPKYRLLVEQLAQQGLLKVICGTDTLGVGVNIPIRTVLFTKLCKFDGTETIILKVRDFKQIAGRAGRKGFDDQGSVVCQAPEHVIENLERERKAAANPSRRRKFRKKQPPTRRFVSWDRKTFESLVRRPPETLQSQFRVSHGTVLNLLQHDADNDDPDAANFDSLRRLISRSHESPERRAELLTEAAQLVRSLHRAGVLKLALDSGSHYRRVVVDEELQFNFSLNQTLALFLVDASGLLDPEDPEHTLDVVTLAESILENPWAVLYKQIDKAKDEERARLKAEGVRYEERRERLSTISYPKPLENDIQAAFSRFRRSHPWVRAEAIHPKSIGREIFESFSSFNDYVRQYGLQRSEGLLLRYLSQLYKVLSQTVPEREKTDDLLEIQAFFRSMVERTDSSLLEEWESLVHPEILLEAAREEEIARRSLRDQELFGSPRAFAARVRAEMHQLVRALAQRDFDEAARSVRAVSEASDPEWDAERIEEELRPFFDDYGDLDFSPLARQAHWTRIDELEPRRWRVTQVLLDPRQDNLWYLDGEIDLRRGKSTQSPLFELHRIGT